MTAQNDLRSSIPPSDLEVVWISLVPFHEEAVQKVLVLE
eukprot:CAMPEP_0168545624 /NCGR_PEP_ID=MMETSP0413-20121227/3059_1 /TAXON_ID=136452 /ORGANISM="Filamoeba nolandi, Strain NC-AS-23-1" /LENGTH=38 /DNA_ID= /DNA_START= /DNA_END= /DNA_ORIENTATION=